MKLIRIYAMFLAAGLLALAPSRAQAQAKPFTITLTATYQAAAPNPTGPNQNIQASVTKSVKFTSASILTLIAANQGYNPHGYALIFDPIADQLGATNKATDDFQDASSIFNIDTSGTSVSSGSSNGDTGANKQSMTTYAVMTFDDGKGNSFTVDGLFKVSISQPAPTASQTANSITPNETISFSGSVIGFGTVVDSGGNTDDAVFSGSVSGGGSGQGS